MISKYLSLIAIFEIEEETSLVFVEFISYSGVSREVFWICYMYIVHVDNYHQIFLPFIGRQVWFAQF